MKKSSNGKIVSAVVYMILIMVCLAFVSWIAGLSYENTCVELQEEYLGVLAREKVASIETALKFGKEIENFYGMDEMLESICMEYDGHIDAVLAGVDGEPYNVTFQNDENGIDKFSSFWNTEYQKRLALVSSENGDGAIIEYDDISSMVFTIDGAENETVGRLIIIYDKDELIKRESGEGRYDSKLLIMMVINVIFVLVCICGFLFFVEPMLKSRKSYVKYLPVIFIMLGMLSYIFSVYSHYSERYSDAIRQNAVRTAGYVQKSIDGFNEKGLTFDDLDFVSQYIQKLVHDNKSIENIVVMKNYYDTNMSDSILTLPLSGQDAYASISINNTYLEEQLNHMRLVFVALFVICLMITYEITYIAEIVKAGDTSDDCRGQSASKAGAVVRVLAFCTYTACYTSMPYSAVIMRRWNASVLGLSESLSASLPLTIELFCVLIASLIIQKLFADTRLDRLILLVFPILIICNVACGFVASPLLLIGIRALCGVGFAFLKYWLNSIVAAGARDASDIQSICGQLNGGLLCGITVGASLGAIIAESKGYQFNYYFTAAVCLATMLISELLVSWNDFNEVRMNAVKQLQKANVSWRKIISDRNVFLALVLNCVPLNVGLMYVVSFVPVYMSTAGFSGVDISYTYLINGGAGVYIGVLMINLLKKLNVRQFIGSFIAMLIGAAGILVLVLGSNIGIVLLSAGIMGLFDGYGTPTLTSFFTSLPAAKDADKASVLTVYNCVGSAVQIICPVLYNIIIQPDGKTTYLLIMGLCFAVLAILYYLAFSKVRYSLEEV